MKRLEHMNVDELKAEYDRLCGLLAGNRQLQNQAIWNNASHEEREEIALQSDEINLKIDDIENLLNSQNWFLDSGSQSWYFDNGKSAVIAWLLESEPDEEFIGFDEEEDDD